ncbi:hypothetical protein C8J57DRAFT_1619594 [Mycena rebaudengoi]|nr:hypothetical protein C8J57DRAFT_1619594 [Mycena rebaudengoi]
MRLISGLLLGFLLGRTYASWLDLGIPHSNDTVDVRVFNVANGTIVNDTQTLFLPVLTGHESTTFPFYSFLVEHNSSQKRLMFDLGIRTDPLNFAPRHYGIASRWISLSTIDSVIWSHSHFDHIGDMSKFPNSTGLIIGSETDTRTYPDFPNATLQVSDLAGREVTKIDFGAANLTFSGLKAMNYFGDGSFYFVNTPGHLPGHMTALARVTPTSFISLGGDTFHHAGKACPRPQFQKKIPRRLCTSKCAVTFKARPCLEDILKQLLFAVGLLVRSQADLKSFVCYALLPQIIRWLRGYDLSTVRFTLRKQHWLEVTPVGYPDVNAIAEDFFVVKPGKAKVFSNKNPEDEELSGYNDSVRVRLETTSFCDAP